MRIDELTGYKRNDVYRTAQNIFKREDDGDSGYRIAEMRKFTTYLQRHGFTMLGDGNFGVVYEKPGYPWVFKVFKGDPAYLYFVRYCKMHSGNQNLPQFKGNLIRINVDTYAIRTEKLDKAAPDEIKPLEKMASYLKMMRYWGDTNISSSAVTTLQELSQQYPGIYSILDELSKQYVLDIHQGNVMRRDSTLVLTDPIVRRG